jgi:hypothetical protein
MSDAHQMKMESVAEGGMALVPGYGRVVVNRLPMRAEILGPKVSKQEPFGRDFRHRLSVAGCPNLGSISVSGRGRPRGSAGWSADPSDWSRAACDPVR